MKRKSKKKSTERKQPTMSADSEGVLLDAIRASKDVLEHRIQTSQDALERRFQASHDALERQMSKGFDQIAAHHHALDLAVAMTSKNVFEAKADIKGLKADVGLLKTDVGVLKTDVRTINLKLVEIDGKLDLKADKVKVDALTERVTTLEAG